MVVSRKTNIMKVRCFTNLDGYDCYVDEMACRPIKGDNVTVRYKGNRTSLKIVAITHEGSETGPPWLKIELHK